MIHVASVAPATRTALELAEWLIEVHVNYGASAVEVNGRFIDVYGPEMPHPRAISSRRLTVLKRLVNSLVVE